MQTGSKPKIALCLSGQARFLEEGYREVIYPYVLENNDIDIFIHTWAVDDNQDGKSYINGGGFAMGKPVTKGLMLDVLETYKPTKCLIQKPHSFEVGKYSDRAMPGIRSENLYSMFYSIYKSNQLKREYEKENNFKYDFVIRSRFDVKLNSKIDFTLPNSKMYLPNGCFDPIRGYVDCFGYSNSHYMDIYANTFNQVDHIMQTTNTKLCGEYILRKQLDGYKIQIEQLFWHSLYR
jgi:hypothetical protein